MIVTHLLEEAEATLPATTPSVELGSDVDQVYEVVSAPAPALPVAVGTM